MSYSINSSTTNNGVDNKSNKDNENAKIIPPHYLNELYNAGFKKLVPLLSDSKRANVYHHLITEEEIKSFPASRWQACKNNLSKSKLLDRSTLTRKVTSIL